MRILWTEIRLMRDLLFCITTPLQALDIVKKIDRAVLPPGEVLDETHDEAVLVFGVDDERRNLALAKIPECLQAPLTADEIVAWTIRSATPGDGDRFLETKCRDVVDDFP